MKLHRIAGINYGPVPTFYDIFDPDETRVRHPRDVVPDLLPHRARLAAIADPHPDPDPESNYADRPACHRLILAIADAVALHLALDEHAKRERLRAFCEAAAALHYSEQGDLGIDYTMMERWASLKPGRHRGRPIVIRAPLVIALADAFRQHAVPTEPEHVEREPVTADDVDDALGDGEEYRALVAKRDREYQAAVERARQEAATKDRQRIPAFVRFVFDVCHLPDSPTDRMIDEEIEPKLL